MKRLRHLLLIMCWLIFFNGCGGTTTSTSLREHGQDGVGATAPSPGKPMDTFKITGTVAYLNLEGGFFTIRGDDGSTYTPVNLPEAFKKDGLTVKATVRHKKEAMSIHMVGAIIEIEEISVR